MARPQKTKKLSLHTKVVLFMTAILILFGAVVFMCAEWTNHKTFGSMSTFDKIVNSFFQSVTTRTAGVSTINQNLLTTGSRIATMMLMFIGGAPNSTAGGIKVTTIFIILLFMFRSPNENGDIRLKDRKVSRKVVMRAFRTIAYTIFMLVIAVLLMRILEPESISFESILFECISAISTVGLTMGITPMLTIGSKCVLILLMFVGRVGLITFVMAISNRITNSQSQEIEFANTDIIIG